MLATMLKEMFRESKLGLLIIEDESIAYFNPACEKLLGLPQNAQDVATSLRLARRNNASSPPVKLCGMDFTVDYYNDNSGNSRKSCHFYVIRPTRADLEKRISILETLANYAQDALYVIDQDGNELYFNNHIERFEPVSRSEMLAELFNTFATGNPVIDRYRKYITHDHRDFHCLSTIIPITARGQAIAVCSINKNITEMHNLLNKAADLQNQLHNYSRAKRLSFNGTKYTFNDIIGRSPLMQASITKAQKAALGRAPVLIYGETGTGKELFAQSIHNHGPNADEPFVAINCAAMPEPLLEGLLFGTEKGAFTGAEKKAGLFEQAGKGTLFLDEINNMSTVLQSKLLRALQEMKVRRLGGSSEKPIACRIISATNVDCNKLLQDGKMREDFYYRIAVIDITVPALRERKEDVLVIADYYIKYFNRTYGKNIVSITPELKDILINHNWPGNVRELKHILEGAINIIENEPILTADHLPGHFRMQNRSSSRLTPQKPPDTPNLPKALADVEHQLILKALGDNGFNVSKAARALGIHRQNLQTRMKKLAIQRNTYFV